MERRWKNCLLGLVIAVMVISAGILLATPGTGNTTDSAKDRPAGLAEELDSILIDNKGYKKQRKGPVEFTHLEHAKDYKLSCWDCHHDYKDEENVWVPWGTTQKCSECHDPQKKQDKVASLQKAFHLNCRNCHKALQQQDKDTGPYRECSGCHTKSE